MVSDFPGGCVRGGGGGAFDGTFFVFDFPSLCALVPRVTCFKLLKNGQAPTFDVVRPYWFGTREFCEY
jgi:hypothetical protein